MLEPDPVAEIKRRLQTKSQRELAAEFGVSGGHINHVLHRNREPGPKILDKLGLERVVSYRRKRNRNVRQ
jgi:transcriptional regulator with XRE-family HTH domain